ncbi:MAG: hypothetical protein QM642_09380 [Edaphocola sp.]
MNKDTLWPVHQNTDGYFNTAYGKVVNLNKPEPSTINMADIAAGLSKVCRFGGQLLDFYSVAQHSLLVAAMAPPELKLAALLHDASEAYLGDVISPLKHILGNTYRDVERRFMAVIGEKYGVTTQEFESIKPYDRAALELEHHRFKKLYVGQWQTKMMYLRLTGLEFFTMGEAEKQFTDAFYAYKKAVTTT